MTASDVDWPSRLRDLRDRLDYVLDTTTRHAAGDVTAEDWAAACEALAQSFAALRPLARDAAPVGKTPEIARLLAEIGSRVQTLGELQARLSGTVRQALARLLPNDDLQAYASLGRTRSGFGRGGYG
ncbi:MAG: hypothetical protein ACUVVU_08465 [Tepidimonas sp.]|uniref:hypothetical protein n=1 Tax=Tepidimonas sp. TaxID=2002775 RepID=UPI004054AF00